MFGSRISHWGRRVVGVQWLPANPFVVENLWRRLITLAWVLVLEMVYKTLLWSDEAGVVMVIALVVIVMLYVVVVLCWHRGVLMFWFCMRCMVEEVVVRAWCWEIQVLWISDLKV